MSTQTHMSRFACIRFHVWSKEKQHGTVIDLVCCVMPLLCTSVLRNLAIGCRLPCYPTHGGIFSIYHHTCSQTVIRGRIALTSLLCYALWLMYALQSDDPEFTRKKVRDFLHSHTAYELMPESGKVVLLDTELPVRQARPRTCPLSPCTALACDELSRGRCRLRCCGYCAAAGTARDHVNKCSGDTRLSWRPDAVTDSCSTCACMRNSAPRTQSA